MRYTFLVIPLAIIIAASAGFSALAQWSNPTAAPPGGNPPPSINVSSTTQTKSGGLNIMGNVGIGTTGPAQKLEVQGSAAIGNFNVSVQDFRLQRQGSSHKVVLHWYTSSLESPWYTYGENLIWSGEKAGSVLDTTAGRPYYEAYSPLVGHKEFGFVNVTSGSFTNTNLIPSLVLKNNGNVGIGTTAPGAKLTVAGGRNSTVSTSTAVAKIGGDDVYLYSNAMNSSPWGVWMQVLNDAGSAFPLVLNPNGGNVGIGTTTPDAKLTVDGTLKVSSGDILLASATGKVGIGPATPQAKLDISGGVLLRGGNNTCSATNRGEIVYNPAGAGVADRLSVCMKNAADAYVWVRIVDGGGTAGGGGGGGGDPPRETTPYLYVFDGKNDFRLESDVLFGQPTSFFASETEGRLAYESGKVSNDLYVIGSDVGEKDGKYLFRIKELEQEQSLIDRIRIKAVFHPKDTAVIASHQYDRYYAVSLNDLDIAPRPANLPLLIQPNSEVEVVVPAQNLSGAKLLLYSRAEIAEAGPVKIHLSYFNGTDWKEFAVQHSRVPYGTREIINLPADIKEARFRLGAKERIWITDLAVLENFASAPAYEEYLALKDAMLLGKGSAMTQLVAKDFDYIRLNTSDILEFGFAKENHSAPEGFSRTLMIETDGFYFTKGKEQKQLINLLLEKERSILREKDGTISVNGLLRRVKDAARNLFEVIGENGEKLFGIGSDGSIIGNQNTRGINVGVPLGSREIIVRGLTLASNEYAVSVTPSWNTTVWVSDKHAAGFTARFGTPAPEGASIDYLIQR